MSLGALPATLGPTEVVDWVPVDLAAKIIVELSMVAIAGGTSTPLPKRGDKAAPAFFHVVNPHQSDWKSLTPTILQHMPEETRTVPFIEWVDLLKQSEKAGQGFQGVDEGENPAAKLIDFFDNLQDRAKRFPKARTALLETVKMQRASPTMAELEPVGSEWMELWLRQWGWEKAEQ
jgi:hypothetical protein